MKHLIFKLLILFTILLSSCAPAAPASQPAQKAIASATATPTISTPTTASTKEVFGSVDMVTIPAPSLEGNLVNELTKRDILVYLPPSYTTSEKHFPTVYYLPGYGDSDMIGFNLPKSMDTLIGNGKANEMIIVVANGINNLGGSFYVNSPVTGNWEDFIVKDVVGYVDAHYRTLAQPESRGITGHSMGGYGSLNIAMLHPDVFSAVYSMSPGLFDEKGLAESQMFKEENVIKDFVSYQGDQFTLSYGSAFAPNPNNKPLYFDYPFKEVNGQLVRDDAVWKKWESGFGGIADEAKQYKNNFLKLKGIVVDYGKYDEYDWIPKGCEYFGKQLSVEGIPVKVEAYNGSHSGELSTRIRDFMIPFFSTTLKFE